MTPNRHALAALARLLPPGSLTDGRFLAGLVVDPLGDLRLSGSGRQASATLEEVLGDLDVAVPMAPAEGTAGTTTSLERAHAIRSLTSSLRPVGDSVAAPSTRPSPATPRPSRQRAAEAHRRGTTPDRTDPASPAAAASGRSGGPASTPAAPASASLSWVPVRRSTSSMLWRHRPKASPVLGPGALRAMAGRRDRHPDSAHRTAADATTPAKTTPAGHGPRRGAPTRPSDALHAPTAPTAIASPPTTAMPGARAESPPTAIPALRRVRSLADLAALAEASDEQLPAPSDTASTIGSAAPATRRSAVADPPSHWEPTGGRRDMGVADLVADLTSATSVIEAVLLREARRHGIEVTEP